MAQKKENGFNADENVRFSVCAKLILITALIVSVSLGVIASLFYQLGRADLLAAAEKNSLEANQHFASQAELLLSGVSSDSRALIQSAFGASGSLSFDLKTADFYFSRNPLIAAVFFFVPGRDIQLIVNSQFYSSWGISESFIKSYIENQSAALGRVMLGQTIILNAANYFSRSALAMFFPWQGNTAAGVIFSCENLENAYGAGLYSCMVGASGDVLNHADFSTAYNGTNLNSEDFFRLISENADRSGQMIAAADFSFSAEAGEAAANVPRGESEAVSVLSGVYENIKQFFKPFTDKCKEFFSYAAGVLNNSFNITGKLDKNKNVKGYLISYTRLSIAGVYAVTGAEYDGIFKGINRVLLINITASVLILIISIIFISVFSKTFSSPLKSLSAAAKRIACGDFGMDCQITNKDEIGALSSEFKNMNSALRVFAKFANADVAVKSMRGEISADGALKHSSILFADIFDFTEKLKNFSSIFGENASDKIVRWLNQYYSRMTECVIKTNGYTDKFIGDGIMAHWGTAYSAGSPRKDAFNCVKAALMMRKALFFMNRERKPGDHASPVIRMGFGITSGMVTAGQYGSDAHVHYSVIGCPVNLAARINNLTKSQGADILVSEDTWNLIGDKFITKEMPPAKIDGEEKPVRTYAIINFFGEAKGPQSIDELRSILGIETPAN